MKSVTYKNATYTMSTTTSRGQYKVTKETQSGKQEITSNASAVYDWMDDDSEPKMHKDALQALAAMFQSKEPPYTFRMPAELRKKAEAAAKKDHGRTLPNWLKKVIEEAIEREGVEQNK